jgi:hypothetical protein
MQTTETNKPTGCSIRASRGSLAPKMKVIGKFKDLNNAVLLYGLLKKQENEQR